MTTPRTLKNTLTGIRIATTMQLMIPLIVITLVVISGCAKKSDPAPVTPTVILLDPTLTTSAVTAISQTTATCGGTISSDGGATVTVRGVCWGLATAPLLTGLHTSDGTGTGTFSSQLTGLTASTVYYVRAYATNSQGTAYGSEQSFKTLKVVIDSVTDVEGNIYHVVPIGTQKWLRENLLVTKYRNGEAIPKVTLDAQWKVVTTGAYCTYDNLAANFATYGALYNFQSLADVRGLCPTGWHVPSVAEWTQLATFLGGSSSAGGPMKSTGTIEQGTGLWYSPNTGATNASGFTGIPGGYRINYGTYYSIGNVGYFWSSSDTSSLNGWNYVLDANNGELLKNFNLKNNGFSVRCCKD